MDISAKALEDFQFKSPNIKLVEGTVDKLPFEDASFDVVITWRVLHSLDKTQRVNAFLEMRRVLRIGGLILFSGQSPKDLEAYMKHFDHYQENDENSVVISHPTRGLSFRHFFQKEELEQLAEKSNLKIVELSTLAEASGWAKDAVANPHTYWVAIMQAK